MDTVKYSVTLEKNPNRIESIIRIIWSLICMIPLCILGAISMYIAWPLTFLTVLILSKKIDILEKILYATMKQMVNVYSYAMFLTDERPPIIPEF